MTKVGPRPNVPRRKPVAAPGPAAGPGTTPTTVETGSPPGLAPGTRYERSPGFVERPGAGHPLSLDEGARRAHVVSVLWADHAAARVDNPEGVAAKLKKLEDNAFVFFRGTAAVFYRDLAGLDTTAPHVLLNGDVHPENFGIVTDAHGALQFGVNDFDEATPGPFTFDVRRGAVGFDLLAHQRGMSDDDKAAAVDAFVDGYVDGLQEFAKNHDEEAPAFDKKNAPAVIEDLFKKAAKKDRDGLLERFVDDGRFVSSEDLTPVSDRAPAFAFALRAVRDANNLRLVNGLTSTGKRPVVKDVAIKKNSGTGALDKARYYVLVEGPSKKGDDDVILEFKEEGRSVIDRTKNQSLFHTRLQHAQRVVHARHTQLADSAGVSGHTVVDGKTFLVRERSPHKASVNVDKLDAGALRDYAAACGRALAHAHARGEIGGDPHEIETRILKSFDERAFETEIVQWADQYATQVVADHAAFVAAREAGAL